MALKQLLKNPCINYREIKFNDPSSCFVAYTGFYLTSFVAVVGQLIYDYNFPYHYSIKNLVILIGYSLIISIFVAIFNACAYGIIWLWAGSKIVGGDSWLSITAKACGYAYFYPGLFGLLTIILILLGLVRVDYSEVLLAIFSMWSIGNAIIATAQLNRFNFIQIGLVMLWFIALFALSRWLLPI